MAGKFTCPLLGPCILRPSPARAARKAASSTFVDRIRRQQLVKETDGECRKIVRDGQFLLFHRGKPLLADSGSFSRLPRLASYDQASCLAPELDQSAVFMKLSDQDVGIFAVMVDKAADISAAESDLSGSFTDMRAALFLLDPAWSGLVTGASSLLRWHRNARFCWTCKSPLVRNASGWNRDCPACGAAFHPPTSPVGIALIADGGHERALLIRQAAYPPGMYSCVAGFVDPGEDLAGCVVREGAEEAGVEIEPASVRVVASQHWPNPSGSLMVGCVATTATSDPSPCSREIEAVRWFEAAELRKALDVVDNDPMVRFSGDTKPDEFFVPPKGATANLLIRHWLEVFAKF